jgi:tetratricopeptide (TPR) repeat protein
VGAGAEIVRPRLAALCVCLLSCAASNALAQDDASAAALGQWVSAVRQHTPGKPDAAASDVAGMSYADRRRLNPAMEVFLRDLYAEPDRPRTKALAVIFALIRSVQQDPGVAFFLRRAAILHTDAAVFRSRLPAPPDDAPRVAERPPPGPTRLLPTLPPPPAPLLSNDRFVLHQDGRVIGETGAEWNWPFARSLLDRLADTERTFVGEWYHAVAAYLMAAGDQGDVRGHLQHAARTLPDDPRALFDRAMFAETLGLPYTQVLREDMEFSTASQRMNLDLPSEEKTNAEAEKLYRRTLAIDPDYVEARVRLARLLDRGGQREEAASQIAQALDAKPAGVVGFYAHVVAGRIATARGRYDEALEQYRAASGLFRNAQSALLGASHAATMMADPSETRAPLERLGAASATPDADPWWDYKLGAGRDVNALMTHLWSRITSR